MIEIQLVAGLVLAALAAWQVRRVFRAQEGGSQRRRGLRGLLSARRRMRAWPRPELGDRPMLWKELFTSRARGLTRLVAVLLSLVVGVFLLYWTIWFGMMAFLELRDNGYAATQAPWYANDRARQVLLVHPDRRPAALRGRNFEHRRRGRRVDHFRA